MRTQFAWFAAALACLLAMPAAYAGEDKGDLAQRVNALEDEIAKLKQASFRVGTISEAEVVDWLNEWRDRKGELLALEQQLTGELEKQFQAIKAMRNVIGVMADGDEKNKKQAELMDLERQYTAKRDAGKEELVSKRRRYIDGLHNKVVENASAYAKENHFDLILLSDALLYRSKETEDITQKIIQMMNGQYAAEKKTEPGGEAPRPEPGKNEPGKQEPGKNGPEKPDKPEPPKDNAK